MDSPRSRAKQTPPAEDELLEGKWRLTRKLGAGGMGTVYLATEVELDRKVAIKMLSPTLAHDPEVVARFEKEARMMARLEHPNLVPIYAVGRKGKQPFIVMKYLEGVTLTDHLRQKGRRPLEEVLELMRQVCAGLGLIHARGFVHRDIKPGNVIIAPDGHATILDLGVARDPNSQMTRSGMMIGTPRYMSPEQVLGTARVDHRADLYALGTVLYEMVTGVPVFDSDSDYSVMRMHVDAPVPDPAAHLPQLPREVCAVISRCLAKQPADRFGSAADLLSALESAIALNHSDTTVPAARRHSPSRPVAATLEQEAPRRRPSAVEQQAADELSFAIKRSSRTRRALAVGLVAFAVVTLAAFFRPARGPQPLAIAPLPSPLESSPVIPPLPAAQATPRAEEPAPEPVLPSFKEVPARGEDAPRSQKRPVRDTTRERARTEKGRQGELRVTATLGGELSWAWLDVDGVRKGLTPTTLKLEVGKHELRLTRPGFQNITRQVEVTAGEPARVTVELRK